jgi:zinc transport system permease protein
MTTATITRMATGMGMGMCMGMTTHITARTKRITPMLDDFLVRALLAALGVALAAGPLGCFVIWRRMAYFGDAISHAAILGVSISLLFSVSITAGVLLTAVLVAIAVGQMSGRSLAADTLLGVAAHGSLALGLVALSLIDGVRVDLESYLFGDVLAVTKQELLVIWIGAVAICSIVAWRWRRWIIATLSPDLAVSHGVDHDRERVLLMLTIAILVAVALKVVGALLITAMLIIPAATARGFVRVPETMVIASVLVGWLASISGLAMSMTFDTPTGASIVVSAVALFLASGVLRRMLPRQSHGPSIDVVRFWPLEVWNSIADSCPNHTHFGQAQAQM